MSYCGELTENIAGLDCNNPGVAGVNGSKAWIINFDDIDRALSVVSATGVISDLTLNAGKYAYLIETDPDGIEPSWKQAPGAYRRDQVEQTLAVKIFDYTVANIQRVVDLSKGKFVVVVERNGIKNNPTAPEVKGDNVFWAFGWDSGLVLAAETASDFQDADTGGGINVQLTTGAKRKENRPPYSVFVTSYALTLAMLVALEEPVSP